MDPKVTVLIPVYNGVPYLREAIEGILAQMFQPFELLIVDDASTDGSPDLIRSYRDPRIRYVRNERNLGTSGTMNRGAELARAPYLARMDQDDVSLPGRLAAQVELMERRPDVAATCTWEYEIDGAGRRVRRWRRKLDNFGVFLGHLAVSKSPLWHPSIMFRRQVLLDTGGYDGAESPAEDFGVSMRLGLARYGAAMVPEYLVMLRQHDRRQSVQREQAQAAMMRRIHGRMVERFFPGPDAAVLAALLRLEPEVWTHRSRRALEAALRSVGVFLAALRDHFALSPEEDAALRRAVYRRMGPGVRWGRALGALPSPLFEGAVFGLSPQLVPPLRKVASDVTAKLHKLRYRMKSGVTCW